MQGTKCFSGALIFSLRNEQLGAMRQKMAIFKVGNSVCRVHFFSGARILYSERENQGDDATENDNFQRGKQRLQ